MSLPAVPPFGPTLSSYLYFMLGPACLEAASHITALSCQQWNSCGWRPQEGSVETGAEEAWLTDWSLSGYAESHRGDESRAFLFNNNPSLVPDNSPPTSPHSLLIYLLYFSKAAPNRSDTCCLFQGLHFSGNVMLGPKCTSVIIYSHVDVHFRSLIHFRGRVRATFIEVVNPLMTSFSLKFSQKFVWLEKLTHSLSWCDFLWS